MTEEAWVKRGSERQRFIEGLRSRVWDKEEEVNNIGFGFELMGAMLLYLRERKANRIAPKFPTSVVDEFWWYLLRQIKEFSRAEQETDWLVGELFFKLFDSEQSRLRADLVKIEFAHSQQIFQAPNAMTEVPLNS